LNRDANIQWRRGSALPQPPPQLRPRRSSRFDLVVMAASVGGVAAFESVLTTLPEDFPLPIAIVQHRSTRAPNLMARVFSRHTDLVVKTATEGERMMAGMVYLAPPHAHLMVDRELRVSLKDGSKIRHVLSSANPLFESAALALPGRVIAVVLTGYDRDATDGVQAVRLSGGTVIAQDQATSQSFGMPASAIETGCVDRVLPLQEIGPALVALARS
jgi:two-component system, chemotaxis family, protein-glutamate methylesterase/glutaminase